MNMQLSKTPIGLDGIPAAETVLSHVDGERGELIIAGERVGDLARKTGFEGVTARLWSGGTGQPVGEAAVRAALGAGRERAFARLPDLLGHHARPIDRRRFSRGDRGAARGSGPGSTRPPSSVRFRSSPARWCSGRKGNDPIAPDPTASHAADTLSMMLGRKPDAREVAALDAYFVTVCDHGMNASTFTTRVVASTQADLFAAVTAGYCALTGPLHGGAPEPVLEMLDAIGSSERIKPWVDSALARGERLMGFGHRVYRVRDPRADVLKGAIERLADERRRPAVRRRGRGLYPRRAAAEKSGAPARHQCGVLHRDPARRAENPAAGVYADLRGGARRRLDRACPRAAARRPVDPAEFGLYRADAGVSGDY